MGYIIPCKICGDDHEDTEGDDICYECREKKNMSKDFTANGVCLEHEWDTWGGAEPCPYCDLEILSEALKLACFHIFQIAQAGPTTEEGWRNHFIAMAQAKPLTRDCSIGERVFWQTLDGKRHDGVLREWDSNVAIISVGETTQSVEC